MAYPEELNGNEGLRRREVSPSFMERVETLVQRAERLGIEMHVATETLEGEGVVNQTALFGASLGKVPLADMVIHRLSEQDSCEITPDIIDLSGNGRYDTRLTEPRLVSVRALLDDMLRNSGNTAFRVLANELGGPASINEYYEDKWPIARVETGANGRAMLGKTSATEAVQHMKSIVFEDTGDRWLRSQALQALKCSTSRHGIARFLSGDAPYPHVFHKSGEYNGDSDDPYAFRHDAGFVVGKELTMSYAVLTRSPMKMRGVLANMFVAQFGAEVARETSGRNVVTLGSRALRFAI